MPYQIPLLVEKQLNHQKKNQYGGKNSGKFSKKLFSQILTKS